MSGTLMLINPRRRRRAKTASRKRRRSARRNASPFAANPVRRRRSYRRNPIRARRRRRNPISLGNPTAMIMDAFKGAAGAVAVNFAFRYMPDTLKTSKIGLYGTKAALAIGLGLFGRRLMPGSLATKMAEGALTVLATDITRDVAAQQGVDLSGGAGFYSPAVNVTPSLTRATRSSLGAYTRVPGVIPLRRMNTR